MDILLYIFLLGLLLLFTRPLPSIPLLRNSESQCRRQSHASESFLKVEGRGALVGANDRREGETEELVGGQNQGPVAPPRSKKGQEKRKQRRCQERSDGEEWVCQGH